MQHNFNIITIDPGINHLGLSVCEIDFQNKEVIKTFSTTLHVKEKNLNKRNIELYGLRQCKIDYLNEILIKYIEKYKPITVVVESPAFLPLIELLYQIRMTIREFENINYVSYEPSLIKKTVGASAICKKDEVKKYVLINKDFFKLEKEINIEDLDEHAIDSLAILYTHFQKVIKNL